MLIRATSRYKLARSAAKEHARPAIRSKPLRSLTHFQFSLHFLLPATQDDRVWGSTREGFQTGNRKHSV